jgi:hypothetical protein
MAHDLMKRNSFVLKLYIFVYNLHCFINTAHIIHVINRPL